MKKSNFVLLQLCQWRMNLDPQVRQDNFISGALSFSFTKQRGTDGTQSFTHFNPSTQRARGKMSSWTTEEQNKFIPGNKMGKKRKLWDLELTFLLSSISCSNMALNTGERAEKRKMQENQEQSRIEEVHWVCWTLSPNYRGAKRSSGRTQAPLKACQETFRENSWKLATFVYSSGWILLSQHWGVWHEKSINMWMCLFAH